MPNNLSSGERWPEKFHEIVHHVLFVIVMNAILNFPSRSRDPKSLSRSPLACISGEREFPFPVIPGNTSLKFPFPSRGIL